MVSGTISYGTSYPNVKAHTEYNWWTLSRWKITNPKKNNNNHCACICVCESFSENWRKQFFFCLVVRLDGFSFRRKEEKKWKNHHHFSSSTRCRRIEFYFHFPIHIQRSILCCASDYKCLVPQALTRKRRTTLLNAVDENCEFIWILRWKIVHCSMFVRFLSHFHSYLSFVEMSKCWQIAEKYLWRQIHRHSQSMRRKPEHKHNQLISIQMSHPSPQELDSICICDNRRNAKVSFSLRKKNEFGECHF